MITCIIRFRSEKGRTYNDFYPSFFCCLRGISLVIESTNQALARASLLAVSLLQYLACALLCPHQCTTANPAYLDL